MLLWQPDVLEGCWHQSQESHSLVRFRPPCLLPAHLVTITMLHICEGISFLISICLNFTTSQTHYQWALAGLMDPNWSLLGMLITIHDVAVRQSIEKAQTWNQN